MIEAMAAGNFEAVALHVLMVSEMLQGMMGMPEAMDAASGLSPQRRALVREQTPATLLEDALNYPGDALREPLGISDLGDAFREPVHSTVPTPSEKGSLARRASLRVRASVPRRNAASAPQANAAPPRPGRRVLARRLRSSRGNYPRAREPGSAPIARDDATRGLGLARRRTWLGLRGTHRAVFGVPTRLPRTRAPRWRDHARARNCPD